MVIQRCERHKCQLSHQCCIPVPSEINYLRIEHQKKSRRNGFRRIKRKKFIKMSVRDGYTSLCETQMSAVPSVP